MENCQVSCGNKLNSSEFLIVWYLLRDIRTKHNEWKSIRWQKVNIKTAFEETESQIEILNSLPIEAHNWECFMGTHDDINNIRV